MFSKMGASTTLMATSLTNGDLTTKVVATTKTTSTLRDLSELEKTNTIISWH
jgi:hypothetical protein